MTAVVVRHMMDDALLNCDMRRGLESRLILQCAPFLKGLKVSCMITLDRGCEGDLAKVLGELGVDYWVLNYRADRILVFLYRKDEFGAYLQNEETRNALVEYGYCDCYDRGLFCVESLLSVLTEKLKKSADPCGFLSRGGFPHEIGILLGYPVDDVKGFIRHSGRNALLTGYWKVYTNPVEAQILFHIYDIAKVCVVNQYLAGKSIREIAKDEEGFSRTVKDNSNGHSRGQPRILYDKR